MRCVGQLPAWLAQPSSAHSRFLATHQRTHSHTLATRPHTQLDLGARSPHSKGDDGWLTFTVPLSEFGCSKQEQMNQLLWEARAGNVSGFSMCLDDVRINRPGGAARASGGGGGGDSVGGGGDHGGGGGSDNGQPRPAASG
jgi:uncharacterized membrane protein YgcG